MVRFNICFNSYLFNELKVIAKYDKLKIHRFTIIYIFLFQLGFYNSNNTTLFYS